MQINVSGLLRDFPKAKKAALQGGRVIIKTREGNLVLMSEHAVEEKILGSMKGSFQILEGVDLTLPTTLDPEWRIE